MKVKDYLVGRILKLEEELKSLNIKYDQLMIELKEADKLSDNLTEQLDDYEMEKEHIKQIIACNLEANGTIPVIPQLDLNTLLAILDIQPGDYEMEDNNAENTD